MSQDIPQVSTAMDLTGRWIVTMGIVTMGMAFLSCSCSTAISWCWGPAAARQSVGVGARLQHGNQLVLGPGCSTAISCCWGAAAARQSVVVGARLQHGNQLVLGPRTALVHYANHNVAVDDRFYVALFSALKESLRSCLM